MLFRKGDVRFSSRQEEDYFVIDRYHVVGYDQSQNPIWVCEAEDCAEHYDPYEIVSAVQHLNRCEPWFAGNG